MGRVNKSGKSIDKESYQYYKKLFQATSSYYRRKGYVNLIPSFATGNKGKDYLSYEMWNLQHDINKISNKELVYNQFHEYTKDQTKILQLQLKAQGVKLSLSKISRGELTAQAWDAIKNTYYELRDDGLSATDAKNQVASMYWGSP